MLLIIESPIISVCVTGLPFTPSLGLLDVFCLTAVEGLDKTGLSLRCEDADFRVVAL